MVREILDVNKGRPLYGLLLTGGRSTRMGFNKALIRVHGYLLYKHLAGLLDMVCDKTLISCREEQISDFTGYPVVKDCYPSHGPVTGILSALEYDREANWLVIPVDTPNLTSSFLQAELISRSQSTFDATVIREVASGSMQPLIAIYRPSSFSVMLEEYRKGHYSLKRILSLLNVQIIDYSDQSDLLANYNTPDDWHSR